MSRHNLRIPYILAVAGALALATSSHAGPPDEAAIRRAIEGTFKAAQVTSIQPSPVAGFSQVLVGDAIVYVDNEGRYVFDGTLFDMKTRTDLTAPLKEELNRIDLANLPLQLAVKRVRGDGSRTVVTFEDPNCGYCKKLQTSLAGVDNVTVHTFLLPILSADSTFKTKAILCAADPAKALEDVMNGGPAPAAKGDCEAPVSQLIALGKKYRVNGTPTIVFKDGKRVPGYMTAQQLEQRLSAQKVATR